MLPGTLISPQTSIAIMQAQQAKGIAAAKSVEDSKEMKKIDEAAKDFEAVFISEMLKPMFENTTPSSPFNGGKGEEIFQGMMIQEYGKMLVDHGGVGMSTQIREQLIKMQQQANSAVKQ